MNNIEITGGTLRQRNYVESMVRYCIKMLMPRMRTLDITVKLCKPKGALGYCLREDNRIYEIEIDSTQRLRRMLETVAHEMVHVKQYARREMNDVTIDKHYKWKDSLVPENTNYWDLPWEIEAHGRECGLFVRWAEENEIGDKKWTQTG